MQAWECSSHPERSDPGSVSWQRWHSEGQNCWMLFCLRWAQWSNVNHGCHLSIFPARKSRTYEHVGLVVVLVGVRVFCRSGTTMSEDWLPVMDAGPADTKYLAHVLEARPKSLLLLLRRTVRSSASLLRSGCWLHQTSFLSSLDFSVWVSKLTCSRFDTSLLFYYSWQVFLFCSEPTLN